MLSSQNQILRFLGFSSSGFAVSFFLGVSDEKHHLAVDDDGDVESVLRLRSGSESGTCEVPKHTNIPPSGSAAGDGELLGTGPFPENEGIDMEVESRGRERKGIGERKRGEGSGGGGVEV